MLKALMTPAIRLKGWGFEQERPEISLNFCLSSLSIIKFFRLRKHVCTILVHNLFRIAI